MIIDLFLIACCVVFIIDLSGISDTIKKVIWKWLKNDKPYQDFELKIITCSLCLTHHTLVIYLLCTGDFSILNYFLACMLSFLTPTIKNMLILLQDFLLSIIELAYSIFLKKIR